MTQHKSTSKHASPSTLDWATQFLDGLTIGYLVYGRAVRQELAYPKKKLCT
jgi:hypothetical protein